MQGGSEYEPEPEPQPDTRSPAAPMQRAPVAAKKDGPDLLQQLQVKQLERVQLSVQFLTTPAVRTQNKRKKLDYLKKQLHVSDAEAEEAHKRAQDALLQPALAFLQNPQVVPQPIDRKVGYIRQKLGLHDCDIEEAFRRTGDTKSGLYFRTSRISQAVKFLTNPALKNRPGDAKVKYLKNEFGMNDDEVKESFRKVIEYEQFAKKNAGAQKAAAAAARVQRASALQGYSGPSLLGYYGTGSSRGSEEQMVAYYSKR